MKNVNKWYVVAVVVIAIGAFGVSSGKFQQLKDSISNAGTQTFEAPKEPEKVIIPEKEGWKDTERKSPEFIQQVEDELEKRYWLEMKKRSDEELLKLQDKGFSGETVSAVRSF